MAIARQSALHSLSRKRIMRELRNSAGWYPFILVNLIVFVIFTAVPYVLMIQYSFTQYDMLSPMKYIGLKNFIHLTDDRILHIALKNTLAYTLMDVPLNVTHLLDRGHLHQPRAMRGMGFFRTLFFLPNITSITVLALIFFRLLAPRPDGPLNYFTSLVWAPMAEMAR